MKPFWILGVFVVGAFFCSCGDYAGSIRSASSFASPGSSYGKALEKATRKAELYNGVGTVAKGWATWKNSEFNSASKAAKKKAYGSEDGRFVDGQNSGAITFHLALYTPDKGWNDLDSAGSLWTAKVELPGGKTLSPKQIVEISKKASSSIEFPYVTPWTKEYELLFPYQGEEPLSVALTLAGPLGVMEFDYR